MNKNWVRLVAWTYIIFSIFFLILFPIMYYITSVAHPYSLGTKIRVFVISYSIVVGLLYAISARYTFRSNKAGFIIGIITSVLGGFFYLPLAGLLITLIGYFLAKQKIQGCSEGSN